MSSQQLRNRCNNEHRQDFERIPSLFVVASRGGAVFQNCDTIEPARGRKSVPQQACDGHRTDATRNRRDGAGDLTRGIEVNITDEARLAFFLGRRPVDANVDHHRAGLDPIALYHPGSADGGDQDVGASAYIRQIAGPGMGHGHRAMAC